jgi:hypothetical protein
MAATVVRSRSVWLQVIAVEAIGAAAILGQTIVSPSPNAAVEWQARALAAVLSIPFIRLAFGGVLVEPHRVRIRNAFRTSSCKPEDVAGVEWVPDAILGRDVAGLRLRDGRLMRVSLISPSRIKGREGMEHVLDRLRTVLRANGAELAAPNRG